jgi:hypothetical protein
MGKEITTPDSRPDAEQLLEVCPIEFVPLISSLPEEYFGMAHSLLLKKILEDIPKMTQRSVKQSIETLRHTFWLEFDAAVDAKKRMSIMSLCRGAIRKSSILNTLSSHERIAYMIYPPHNYQARILTLLDKSLDKIEEILELPLTEQPCRCRPYCKCKVKGEPKCRCGDGCICPIHINNKLIGTIGKIHESLELRAKGALLQRVSIDKRHLVAQIHQQSAGLISNIEHKAKELAASRDISSLEDIDAQIKLLESNASKEILRSNVSDQYSAKRIVNKVMDDEISDREDMEELEGD